MRRIIFASLAMTALLLPACANDDSVGVAASTSVAPSLVEDEGLPAPEPDAAVSPAATAINPSPAATPTPSPVEVAANAAALDFSARRVGGGTIDGIDFAGEPVVLWMWAPWCPQCNREAPHVAEAIAALGDEVTIIGVAGHDDDAAHEAFVAEHGIGGVPHAIDEDGSLWAQYGVSYQPAWVFIAEDGTTTLHAGALYGDLEEELRSFLDA